MRYNLTSFPIQSVVMALVYLERRSSSWYERLLMGISVS